MLKVTQVSVYVYKNNEGKLRGQSRIVLEDCIQLTGLRIYEGSRGLFVSYPNDPYYKGEDYRQLFYPLTKDFRDEIEKVVLEEYNKVLSQS